MLQYIYFVKCPNCEDEPFDFFDEAKEFAYSCMSNKPIITQVEVERNDFGECVDSADLGTVWSWEDMMKDTATEAEPAKCIFTRDDLKQYIDDEDPEFDNLDNSVDVEITENLEHIQYCPACGAMNEYSDSQDNGSWVRYTCRACDNTWDIDKPRKPIPEGMTIEQLVEEMEENEDTVECTWCNDLFDKDQCRKEVNLGYLCSRCEAAIKSRGEKLTFEENNYWDFLDESLEELTFSDMVSDSIRHLVNDLGKDPEDENFADDVIIDIENNYETQIPEDPIKYIDWASAVACEVSRQLNNQGELNESASESSSTKTFDPKEKVELEYKNIEVTVELGRDQGWDDYYGGWDEPIEKDLSGNFTYEVDALEVASVIWENFLDDDLIMSLPGGPEAMECDYLTDEASLKFWGLHFEDLVKKYYDKLLEFFREDALEAAREAFANDYLED